ncbi:MAG TPA: efflux RND transporter periplasmic adaptor subunit [Bryobacteraceae bacterium]|nr:efflux RND transporter periplasmic adaptor subunit [Bryobacteraceae bacterium]
MSLNKIYFVAGLAVVAGCSREPKLIQASTAPPVNVQFVTSERTEWAVTTDAVGTVRARTTAVLSSKVMGYVREVRVRAGDRVKADQTLIVLDARDLDVSFRQAQAARDESRDAQTEATNAIAAAKANLDLAQATFRRMQELYGKRSISNQEFDEASARQKAAQAAYDIAASKRVQIESRIRQAEEGIRAAEVMRGYAEIHAPFSGIVTERRAEPGVLATPGLPMLAVEQGGAYRLEVNAEESLGPLVHLGQKAQVGIDSLGRSFEAPVSEIVPAVDPGSRGFLVKIDLPALKDVKSGLYGRARFTTGSRQALTVPAEVVRRNGQIESVLVADNGIARMRLITTGETVDGHTEVLTGLRPGETVVRNGDIADGARVEGK